MILVGGPRANQAVSGLVDRGVLDLGGLTAEGAYLLKSVDLDGRGCLVAAGRDDTGTMYAAYELLERLGVVFQLTGDILPERKATLELPELDVAAAPARTFRGVHVWHAYTWNMGMEDYRRLIDQLAKMKNVLEFYWGMGAPRVEVFHDGVRGELTTTPESGYLAVGRDSRSWGRSVHTTTGTRSEVRVGRECFPHERLCGDEVREVGSEDEAFAVAIPFLREIIRYAHRAGERRRPVLPGRLYITGTGVEQDDAEAVRWLRLAGGQGVGVAQGWLGDLYDAGGLGVAPDPEEADAWYRRAAEAFLAAYRLSPAGDADHCHPPD